MHIYTFIGLYSSIYHLTLSNWAIWHTVINNELAYRYFHVGYLSWVIYLYSALCTLKPKKPIKKISKKPRFFPALNLGSTVAEPHCGSTAKRNVSLQTPPTAGVLRRRLNLDRCSVLTASSRPAGWAEHGNHRPCVVRYHMIEEYRRHFGSDVT